VTREAQLGELVQLAVDVPDGDGYAVGFTVQTVDGATVAMFEAPVEAGVARANWQVEVDDRPLPLTLTFVARLGGESAQAGTLEVVAPGRIGAVALRGVATGGAAPGQLGPLRPGLPDASRPTDCGDHAGAPTDAVALCIDLAGPDGAPLAGSFALRIVAEAESRFGRGDFAVTADEAKDGDAAGHHAVHLVVRRPAGAGGPPPRLRFRVGWHRRPGESLAAAQPLSHTTVPA
jgi:hypothetical protein